MKGHSGSASVLIGNRIDKWHQSSQYPIVPTTGARIRRNIETRLRKLARSFPVLTVTGPRQAGKTTACRRAFPNLAYVSLEDPDSRDFALADPRGFLGEYSRGAIFDEAQRAPQLLSYIQTEVDDRPAPGRFVLTGSADFALLQSVTQSLAGRTATVSLLPLTLDEVRRFDSSPNTLMETLWMGSYPALFDRQPDPVDWYGSYVTAYVERDVRQLINVGDLVTFQTFIRLCAGRTAQLLNLSALASDCGVSHNTVRAWISVLEASYLVKRIPAFHANVTSRLVKAPKLHFLDSGLACFLLGVRNADQLVSHPSRGAIFESWTLSEILKSRLNSGTQGGLSHLRTRKGDEIDLVVERSSGLAAVESKSGATISSDFFAGFETARELLLAPGRGEADCLLVYGGGRTQSRSSGTAVPWSKVSEQEWV